MHTNVQTSWGFTISSFSTRGIPQTSAEAARHRQRGVTLYSPRTGTTARAFGKYRCSTWHWDREQKPASALKGAPPSPPCHWILSVILPYLIRMGARTEKIHFVGRMERGKDYFMLVLFFCTFFKLPWPLPETGAWACPTFHLSQYREPDVHFSAGTKEENKNDKKKIHICTLLQSLSLKSPAVVSES